ncbi:Prophage integrase IntA [Burkholderiaceae bacterium]|nr:Prophage integrase IntA [Burkholderiaceae bacterium]
MARELLTARKLDSLLRDAITDAAARNTRIKIRDGENLMLIVRPNGGASWVLEYRHERQRKPYTLGAWPAVKLADARALADKARSQLAHGVDLVAQRQAVADHAKATRAAAGYTVLRLFEDWMAKKTGSAVYLGNIRAAFVKDVLPEIGYRLPGKVTRQDVLSILRKLEERGALVLLRRVRMWLKQMYEYALDADIVTSSPVPTGHLKSFLNADQGHFPAITNAAEIPRLMRAIRGYEHTIVRTALLLCAHLFQRPSELREATIDEFDMTSARWTIPAERMKKRREHWVPLSRQVVALLRSHLGVVGSQGYLLPGRRYEKPISEGTMNAALNALGFQGRQTVHGFRATARTILEEHLHVDERFIEKQLAHEEQNKTKRAYNRAEYWAERVKMMQAWSDWLDAQR